MNRITFFMTFLISVVVAEMGEDYLRGKAMAILFPAGWKLVIRLTETGNGITSGLIIPFTCSERAHL